MSMLAERKRKQKWSLNPRGNSWSSDANKFGQKMLEKMGWQHGKGLGANENGRTEHVKISYKNDSKGMGYKESDDQWTEHETNFTSLLKSLTENSDQQHEDVQLNSLEEKSQNSKARVHYRKFTRGKDLTRYSEKDLANIFGKKSLKVSKKDNKDETPIDTSPETHSQENSQSFLVNSGSMTEYFKKKLPGFSKSNGYVVGNNGVLKKEESDSESEIKTFGFGYSMKSEESVTMDSINEEFKSSRVPYIEHFKKRKIAENHVENIFSPKKKLKKKNKEDIQTGGLTNPAFEPLASHITFQKNVLDPIPENNTEECEEHIEEINLQHSDKGNSIKEDNFTKSKKKKPKRKNYCYDNNIFQEIEMDNNSSGEQQNDNPTEIEEINYIQSLKKKNKLNILLEGSSNELKNDEEKFQNVKISKKLKKKKGTENTSENSTVENLECVFDNPNFNEDVDSSISQVDIKESNPYEVKPKMKKRKKDKSGIDNTNFNESDSIEQNVTELTENPYEVPLKKKKKKQKPEVDETIENNYEVKVSNQKKRSKTEIVEEKIVTALESAYEVIKPKKKKKSKKEFKAIDNPTFNPNDSIESENRNDSQSISSQNSSIDIEESDLMLNVVSTPQILKKPKEQNISVQSETKSNSKRRKNVRFSDVTQELIIPNNDDLRKLQENDGVDNVNFDRDQNNLEENMEHISNTIDRYQAEIENEINEQKQFTFEDFMVGEVGNPEGENEKLPEGTKLKFKYAHFDSKTPIYQQNKVGPKKSYKHLIKGDIILKFNNSNLHEIQGYALQKKQPTT